MAFFGVMAFLFELTPCWLMAFLFELATVARDLLALFCTINISNYTDQLCRTVIEKFERLFQVEMEADELREELTKNKLELNVYKLKV